VKTSGLSKTSEFKAQRVTEISERKTAVGGTRRALFFPLEEEEPESLNPQPIEKLRRSFAGEGKGDFRMKKQAQKARTSKFRGKKVRTCPQPLSRNRKFIYDA